MVNLNKNQIINAIQQINHSVDTRWLSSFNEPKLRAYLEHLQLTIEPRGRHSIWRRTGDTPAVMTRRQPNN